MSTKFEMPEIEAALAELAALEGKEVSQVSPDDDDLEAQLLADVDAQIKHEEEVAKSYESIEKEVAETPSVAPTKATPVTSSPAEEAPKKKHLRPAVKVAASAALAARLGSEDAVLMMLSHEEHQETDPSKLESFVQSKIRHIDDAPKKVGEKIVNACAHINNAAQLSVYTRITVELLAKHGTVTSDEIVKEFLAHPYSIGTSRSQCGQMMHLMPLLGIANRSNKILTLKKNSPFFNQLVETLKLDVA